MTTSLSIASKRRVVGKEGVQTGTAKGRMRRREGGHAIHRDTQGRIWDWNSILHEIWASKASGMFWCCAGMPDTMAHVRVRIRERSRRALTPRRMTNHRGAWTPSQASNSPITMNSRIMYAASADYVVVPIDFERSCCRPRKPRNPRFCASFVDNSRFEMA